MLAIYERSIIVTRRQDPLFFIFQGQHVARKISFQRHVIQLMCGNSYVRNSSIYKSHRLSRHRMNIYRTFCQSSSFRGMAILILTTFTQMSLFLPVKLSRYLLFFNLMSTTRLLCKATPQSPSQSDQPSIIRSRCDHIQKVHMLTHCDLDI